MKPLFDPDAQQKPTNLSLNSDLLEKCQAIEINLSVMLEQALTKELVKTAEHKWAQENKKAIDAYNEFVDTNGCFGEECREG